MPCAACGTGVPCVATDTLSGWVKIQESLVPHVAWGAWSTKWCGERWFFLCDDCGLATYSKDHSNDWFWKWYRRHMGTWFFFKPKWQAKYGRNFKRRRMVEWWPTEAEPPATAAKVEPKEEPAPAEASAALVPPVAAEPALAEASGALQPPAEPTPAEASGALQHLAAAELPDNDGDWGHWKADLVFEDPAPEAPQALALTADAPQPSPPLMQLRANPCPIVPRRPMPPPGPPPPRMVIQSALDSLKPPPPSTTHVTLKPHVNIS